MCQVTINCPEFEEKVDRILASTHANISKRELYSGLVICFGMKLSEKELIAIGLKYGENKRKTFKRIKTFEEIRKEMS